LLRSRTWASARPTIACFAPAFEVELDLDRGEHLPGFVMQLARDAAPLLFLRPQQQSGELLELMRASFERAPSSPSTSGSVPLVAATMNRMSANTP
jgi:hypothetical protein